MRWLWAGLGFILLGLGAVGLVLPIWPTTIFWILAVFCLAESHPKVRDWIYRQPGVGSMIESFVERGEISRSGKIAAIGGIGLTGVISGWLLRGSPVTAVILIACLVGVSIFVATRREPDP